MGGGSGSGSGSRRIQVMIPMDRARNSDQFTFLKFENPSTGSKVRSHQSWALFVQKSFFTEPIFKNKSNIVKFAKNCNFWAKIWTIDKKSITFEPLDGFSKFKCLNAPKFCQEFNKNIRLPGSVDPDPKKDPDLDPDPKTDPDLDPKHCPTFSNDIKFYG